MSKLNHAIKQLEEEISRQRQILSLQYQQTKTLLFTRLTAPSTLLIAFMGGGLIGKRIKRRLKSPPPSKTTAEKPKTAWPKKWLTLFSELSTGFNFLNFLKKTLIKV